MFVIEKMKLNRFEVRPVVSARALVASKGLNAVTVQSQCGSDCYDSPSIDGASKTKILGLCDEMAKTAYAKRESDGQSPSMTPKSTQNL